MDQSECQNPLDNFFMNNNEDREALHNDSKEQYSTKESKSIQNLNNEFIDIPDSQDKDNFLGESKAKHLEGIKELLAYKRQRFHSMDSFESTISLN